MKRTTQLIIVFLLVTLAAVPSVAAGEKPVCVFILAGQSNMEGAGRIKADPNRNGGKGSVDFRPPSAGKPPYSLGEKGDAALAQDPAILGKYFRETVTLTKAALASIKDLVPGSDGRYVLAGFGWHQGWNDRINDRFNAEYESNMAHFIRIGEAMGEAMKHLLAPSTVSPD